MTQLEILDLLKALLHQDSSPTGHALRVLVLSLIRRRQAHARAVREGLARARGFGHQLGRPRRYPPTLMLLQPGETFRQAEQRTGCSRSTLWRWNQRIARAKEPPTLADADGRKGDPAREVVSGRV